MSVAQIPPRASANDLFVLKRKPLKSTGHLVSAALQRASVSSPMDGLVVFGPEEGQE